MDMKKDLLFTNNNLENQLYNCPMCGDTGFTAENLLRHIIANHNRNSFHIAVCPICLADCTEYPVPLHQDLIGHLTNYHLLNLPDVPTFEPDDSISSYSTDTDDAPNDIFGESSMSPASPQQINFGLYSPNSSGFGQYSPHSPQPNNFDSPRPNHFGGYSPSFTDNSLITWQRPGKRNRVESDEEEIHEPTTLSMDRPLFNHSLSDTTRFAPPHTAYGTNIHASKSRRCLIRSSASPDMSQDLHESSFIKWQGQNELEKNNFRFVHVDIVDPAPKYTPNNYNRNASMSSYNYAARNYAAEQKLKESSKFLLNSQATTSKPLQTDWSQEREFVCELLVSSAVNHQPMKAKHEL